jgi:UDP-N-acetylmuramate--alanine ligase
MHSMHAHDSSSLPRHIHLLGAGGAGVSAAAEILHARGHVVTGHDQSDSSFVQKLRALGIPVATGASAARLLPIDAQCVVRSAAIADADPQVELARQRGLPVLKYAEVLGLLGPRRRTIGIAGTHGKTTTSWLVHHAMSTAASSLALPQPAALVGGICRVVGSNAALGDAQGWFACEACEYDRSFLNLSPEGAIVTNVEADHLDYYGSLEAIVQSFARYADRLHPEGLLVVGRDVPDAVEAAAPCTTWRLGRDFDVELAGERSGRFRFRVRGPGWLSASTELQIPGSFNVENAALAIAMVTGLLSRGGALPAGLVADAAAQGVARYKGAKRRFEPWGEVGGIEVVHDYAHHPTEVRVTIEAARRALPGRPLHVLFQPHQHSRTARFLDDFVESLRGADRVVVAEVYGARAHIDRHSAGAAELVARLKKAGVDAVEGGARQAAVQLYAGTMPRGAAALVLGAGDIDLSQHDLLDALALRGAPTGASR